MTRFHLLPASLLLTTFLAMVPPEGWAGGGPQQRYRLPQDGRPGRVETEEYFKIDDPQEAARLLLEESRLAGVDIDLTWESPRRHAVLLGSGSMTPDTNDRGFFTRSRTLVEEGHADSAFVCVLKLGRNPTIREQATMMEMGVRFFVSIPHYAYIVRTTAEMALQLETMPAVEWMDELRPEQKYPPMKRFESGYDLAVYTLVGDTPECRADLERLGGSIRGFGLAGIYHHIWHCYGVQVDVSRVDEIASLWWVQKIDQIAGEPDLEFVSLGNGRENTPDASAAFSASLKPRDSRRLVSYQKDGRYRGYSQTAFVYEVACDWNHAGLRSNALTSSSSANTGSSTAILHGTMVAGVVAGVEQSSVLGGGVSGVAQGATFQYTVFTPPHTSTVLAAASGGLWLQNHSWGRSTGVYQDSLGVYTEEAYLFDQWADQHNALFIKSAGNEGTNTQYGPVGITSPGTGKNVLTVGAVKYISEAGDTVGQLVSYSSQGPTRDDILKPELVAPGGNHDFHCGERGVVSCGTSNAPACKIWDSGYVHAADAGTSFAAAHVTGAAAIMAEAYEEWHQLNPNMHPAAFSPLLMKALLINTAIPLRWSGFTYGRVPGSLVDTLVTAEFLSGFANTEYGYGLVNCYSGVHSSDSEYRRMLTAEDVLVGVADHEDFSLPLRIRDDNGQLMRPRYLLVTMAYNDLPGAGLVDRLKLSLVDPLLGRTYVYQPPSGITAGTVQKIIVPWPSHVGQWQVRVTFEGTSSSRPLPEQQFVVVADVMFQAPALGLVGLKPESDPYEIRAGQTHTLDAVVENIADNVATGVTVRIEDPFHQLPPSFEFDKDYYVGNLVKRGDRQSRSFPLGPFPVPGEYSVDVVVNCVNKLLGGGPYPLKKRVKIRVLDLRVVRGEVVMLPGWNQSVENAAILIDGVASGKKTDKNGKYEVEVEAGFAGRIKPRKGTSIFIPEVRDYSSGPIATDLSGQGFEAEFRRLSGRVFDESGAGASGVTIVPVRAEGTTLRASPGAVTASNGAFEVFVEHGWSGRLVPQPNERYVSFTPTDSASISYDSVIVDKGACDFSTRVAVPWAPDGELLTESVAVGATPRVIGDATGGAIVVWKDSRAGSGAFDVWARKVTTEGVSWQHGEVPVCRASGVQENPQLARLTDGTFVVVWVDERTGARDLFAQRLDPDGPPLWTVDGIPLCDAQGNQDDHSVAATNDGGFVVVWQDRRMGNGDIYIQKMSPGGNPVWLTNGIPVSTGPGEQTHPRMDLDAVGGAFVVWQERVGEEDRVLAAHLDAGGEFVWGAGGGAVVSDLMTAMDRQATIVASQHGECLVAYRYPVRFYGNDIPKYALRRLDAAGSEIWAQSSVGFTGDIHTQGFIELAATNDGGAVLAYPGARPSCCADGGSDMCPIARVHRFDSTLTEQWEWESTALTEGTSSTAPKLLVGADGAVYVAYLEFDRPMCNFTSGQMSTVRIQRIDETGCRLWGTGLTLRGATANGLGMPAIADDLLSGVVVCWREDLNQTTHRLLAARANDTSRSFKATGRVELADGTPVAGVPVQAVDVATVMVSRTTAPDGTFVIGLPEFWSGNITIKPRGYFNHATPAMWFVPPVTQDVSGLTAVLTHEETSWSSNGLLVSAPTPEAPRAATLVGSPGGGCYLAWRGEDQQNRSLVVGQHIDERGDIRWTTGGDAFAGDGYDDHAPMVLNRGDGAGLFLWNRSAPMLQCIWGQVIDRDMNVQWESSGRPIVAGDQIGNYAACTDPGEHFFVCWNDLSTQRLLVQRFAQDGTPVWSLPVQVGIGVLSVPPRLVEDGSGGLLLGWQSGSYLYVQRVDANGNVLWNGGVHPVTARALAFVTPGDFRFTGRGGGAYMVWSERSEIDSADEKLRMNWIENGVAQLGPTGQPLSAEAAVQLLDDVVYDEGGGIRLAYTVVYGATTKLVAQSAVPHVGGTISYPWGEGGRTVSAGLIFPRNSRLVNDEDGGMLVFWREQGGLYAQRLDWYGNFLWFDRRYRVFTGNIGSEDELVISSDEKNGAYIAWLAPDGNLMATRHSDSLLVNADVSVSSVVRKLDYTILPMEGNHAVACPGGDEDNVVVRLDLEGEMMNFISAEAIQVVPPALSPVLFQATIADSAPRWHGDRFRTTVTLSEIGGCGHDSAEVQIYGSPVGIARFSIRNPDLEIVQSPGEVNISDFAKFGTHLPPYGVPPSYASYSECADFVEPEGTPITVADFGFFGTHLHHTWQGGGALVLETPAQSVGRVVLAFEQGSSPQGQRSLAVDVGLENIEPFQAAVISLKNVNPHLGFDGWLQDTSYPYATMCTELYRDGVRQVMIGVLGAKGMTTRSAALGKVNLRVSADEELALTDDDFELIVGEILTVDGRPMSVAPRRIDPVRHIRYGLWQNFPNPFNPTTTIQYSIAEDRMVDLRVYDVRGALVKTLVNGPRKRDVYKIVWDGHNNIGNPVASGVYFCRLKAGDFVSTKKMVLLR